MSDFDRTPTGFSDDIIGRLTFAAIFLAAGLFAAVVWLTH
jgi:hypothetical protein